MTRASWSPGGECTVYGVHALREQLMATLQSGQGLSIDLAEVSEFDGAGLQLLLAARHEARQRGLAFHVGAMSAIVSETLVQVGLADLLTQDPGTGGAP